MTAQHRPLSLWAVPAVCAYGAGSTGWLHCPLSGATSNQVSRVFLLPPLLPLLTELPLQLQLWWRTEGGGVKPKDNSGEHWKQKAAEHSLSSSTSSPQDLWVFFLIQHLLETGPARGSGDIVLRSGDIVLKFKENEASAYPETHLGGCWVTLNFLDPSYLPSSLTLGLH